MQCPDILDLSAAEAEQQGSSTSFCCKETAIFFSLTNNLKSSMIITMEETLKTRVMLLDQRGDQTHNTLPNAIFLPSLLYPRSAFPIPPPQLAQGFPEGCNLMDLWLCSFVCNVSVYSDSEFSLMANWAVRVIAVVLGC